MENSFQTSFIPKKPIGSSSPRFREPVSIFLVIPILMLVVSVLASILLLIYKNILVKQEAGLSTSLLNIKDSFDQNKIKELTKFDNRTKIAKDLLNKHVIFSPMFKILADVTIPSVQYKKFEQITSDENVTTINIEGIAKDYKSIAIQSDAFNTKGNSSFKNVFFSNILKDKNGDIGFKLNFTVNPNILSYQKSNIISENPKEEVGVTSNPVNINPLLDNKTQ